MEDKNFNNYEFEKELKELTEKYNLKNIAFCGELKENPERYIGYFGVGPSTMSEFTEIVMNVARLYQSGREKILSRFDYMAMSRG